MAFATSALLVKSTPYSAVYLFQTEETGGAVTIDYTDASTLAFLKAGPYRYQIVKRLTDGSISHLIGLNLNAGGELNRRVRIYQISGNPETETPPATWTVKWVTNGLTVTLPAGAPETTSDLLLEIRFIHSARR